MNAGDYELMLAQPQVSGKAVTTSFSILKSPTELAEPRMNQAKLEYLADVTGGQFFTADSLDSLLDELPAGKAVRVETLEPQSLWNSKWLASAFVVVISAEWLLRNKIGLL